MKRSSSLAAFVVIAAVMVVVDRLSKAWASANLTMADHGHDYGPIALTLVHNRGAAFGMGQGNGWLFAVLAVVIVAAIVVWLLAARGHSAVEVACLGLIAAGGVGNCIDRLTDGYVVDFVQFTFIDFPVFNVADICITCGVVLLVLVVLVSTFGSGAGERSRR